MANAFSDLRDTPAAITANGLVKGNAAGNALEFASRITNAQLPTKLEEVAPELEDVGWQDEGATQNDSVWVGPGRRSAYTSSNIAGLSYSQSVDFSPGQTGWHIPIQVPDDRVSEVAAGTLRLQLDDEEFVKSDIGGAGRWMRVHSGGGYTYYQVLVATVPVGTQLVQAYKVPFLSPAEVDAKIAAGGGGGFSTTLLAENAVVTRPSASWRFVAPTVDINIPSSGWVILVMNAERTGSDRSWELSGDSYWLRASQLRSLVVGVASAAASSSRRFLVSEGARNRLGDIGIGRTADNKMLFAFGSSSGSPQGRFDAYAVDESGSGGGSTSGGGASFPTETEEAITQLDYYLANDPSRAVASDNRVLGDGFVTPTTWTDIWTNTETAKALMHHDIVLSAYVQWSTTANGDRVYVEYRLVRTRASVDKILHRNSIYIRNMAQYAAGNASDHAGDAAQKTRYGYISLESEVLYEANDTVKLQVRAGSQRSESDATSRGANNRIVFARDVDDSEHRNSVISLTKSRS